MPPPLLLQKLCGFVGVYTPAGTLLLPSPLLLLLFLTFMAYHDSQCTFMSFFESSYFAPYHINDSTRFLSPVVPTRVFQTCFASLPFLILEQLGLTPFCLLPFLIWIYLVWQLRRLAKPACCPGSRADLPTAKAPLP